MVALASSPLTSTVMDITEDSVVASAKKKKARMSMSDEDLLIYFQQQLEGKKECMNNLCTCLSILKNPCTTSAVVQYLVWFDKKSKYDQDTLILEWYKYAWANNDYIQGRGQRYCLPFDGSCIDDVDLCNELTAHKLYTLGMCSIMGIGWRKFQSIQRAADSTGVMPYHKTKRTNAHNAVNGENALALKHHFDHLMQLGEV